MNFNVENIKRKMLVKYPFFGSVVANVKYKENILLDTAGTDGKTIYYNPNYLNTLTENEQTFIFAHEVCHIAFNHIFRSEGKEQLIWNVATDAVINAFLKKDGLEVVDGAIEFEDAINYDSEELYNKLLKEIKKRQQGNQNNPNSQGTKQTVVAKESSKANASSNANNTHAQNRENYSLEDENDFKTHDTHQMWAEAVKNKECEKTEEFSEKQKECEQIGEQKAFDENRMQKKESLERLKKEITEAATKAGLTTNSDIRSIENIGKAKPIIDWRYILKPASKYDVDWSYKNASIEDGVVRANLEKYFVPETEILLDTSGSINNELLRNFLRICKNILNYSRIKVGCFDTKFYGFKEIRTEEDIDKMEFQGGGGTNFDVAVHAFSRRVENKIIFTDGWANMPSISLDAVWIVFGDIKINPKGGKVVYITEENLKNLYSFVINKKLKLK